MFRDKLIDLDRLPTLSVIQAVINTQFDRLHRIYGMNEQDTGLLMREQEKKEETTDEEGKES